jgi:hypothetical protein
MAERHGALEQSAWTWTTARTPNKASSEETETVTRRGAAPAPLTVAVSAPLGRLGRVEAQRVRAADQPLAAGAASCRSDSRSRVESSR